MAKLDRLVRGAEWVDTSLSGKAYKGRYVSMRFDPKGLLQILYVTCLTNGPQDDKDPVRVNKYLVRGCPERTKDWNLASIWIDLLKADADSMWLFKPGIPGLSKEEAAKRHKGHVLTFGCKGESGVMAWAKCIDKRDFLFTAAGAEAQSGAIKPGIICKDDANCSQVRTLVSELIGLAQKPQ